MALISNLDVMVSMDSGNAHIAAMLGVKVITLWVLRILMPVSPFHQPLENTLVSDRKISHATHSVYGNKIVVGYEDAMRTITQEMVVMSVQKQLED
jgi:ADP-heptose:LPS heptosyltransferase